MKLNDFFKLNKDMIIKRLFNKVSSYTQNNQNYETVWKEYQTQVCNEFVLLLNENGFLNIERTLKKSIYPEFTVYELNSKSAIDVKVSVDTENPQFDIARLDTVLEKRLKVYENEYEVVIKYNIKTGIVDLYFDEMMLIIGYDNNTGGVKNRAYDGKIRPKSWKDFETGKSYFNTKEELINAIRKSQIFSNKRRYLQWKKEFTEEEFKQILN